MTSRGAAKDLPSALLVGSSTVAGDVVITVSLQKNFSDSFPRPQPEACCKQVQLTYSKGLLGIAELHHAAVGPGRVSIAKDWMSALFPLPVHCDQAQVIHVVDFLLEGVTSKCLQPLFVQVLLGICKGIEKCAGKDSLIRRRGSGGTCFSFQWLDGFHTDGDARSVAPIIAQYVHNSVQLHKHHVVFSIATDKAWVNGLPLQNSIVGNPDCYATLCTPQACSSFLFCCEIPLDLSRGMYVK